MVNFVTRLIDKVFKRNVNLSLTDPSAWPLRFRSTSKSGVIVTPESSLSFSAVFAAVKIISDNLAILPLNVIRETKEGKEMAKDHHTYNLFKLEPNPFYSSANFRKTLVCHYLLWGDAYARILRLPNSKVYRFELFAPWEVTPFLVDLPDGRQEIYYRHKTRDKVYHHQEIIHISDFTVDGIKGRSRITIAKDSIGMALASKEYGNSFYANGTHLGGYIKLDKSLSPDGAKRLRESFKDIYSGPDNIGDIAVLEEGAEFMPYKYAMPLNDAQFVESWNASVKDVARFFTIPAHKLGADDSTSYNSQEQGNQEFINDCLLPIAVLIEQEINRKVFFDEPGVYIKHELKALVRGDLKTRTEHYSKMLQQGVYNRDEVRAWEDLNPIPGGAGKAYTIQSQNITLEQAIENDGE